MIIKIRQIMGECGYPPDARWQVVTDADKLEMFAIAIINECVAAAVDCPTDIDPGTAILKRFVNPEQGHE